MFLLSKNVVAFIYAVSESYKAVLLVFYYHITSCPFDLCSISILVSILDEAVLLFLPFPNCNIYPNVHCVRNGKPSYPLGLAENIYDCFQRQFQVGEIGPDNRIAWTVLPSLSVLLNICRMKANASSRLHIARLTSKPRQSTGGCTAMVRFNQCREILCAYDSAYPKASSEVPTPAL